MATISTVTGIAGLGLVGLGAVLVLTDKKAPSDAAATGFRPTVGLRAGPASLGLGGSF